jgi:hypothetical protein
MAAERAFYSWLRTLGKRDVFGRPLQQCSREFSQPSHEQLEPIGQSEQEVSDSFEIASRRRNLFGVVDLGIAQLSMTIAAFDDGHFIEFATCDVMQFKAERIVLSAMDATRIVGSEIFEPTL